MVYFTIWGGLDPNHGLISRRWKRRIWYFSVSFQNDGSAESQVAKRWVHLYAGRSFCFRTCVNSGVCCWTRKRSFYQMSRRTALFIFTPLDFPTTRAVHGILPTLCNGCLPSQREIPIMLFLMECWFSVPGQSDGFLMVKFAENIFEGMGFDGWLAAEWFLTTRCFVVFWWRVDKMAGRPVFSEV